MWHHLLKLSLAEWRHHPWRHGVALLAVALGVALASSVQMINASALAQLTSQFSVHCNCSGRPSRMNCITRLLVSFSSLVMSAVLSRKAFSDCTFRVERALSEPSYLLRNCSEPV